MINIENISPIDIPRYSKIFQCVYDSFEDVTGGYYKVNINGQEHVLYRVNDVFALFSLNRDKVEYQIFAIDEDYNITDVGLKEYRMHKIDNDWVYVKRDDGVVNFLTFMERINGEDFDGFDGMIKYVQYIPEEKLRLTITYQQMKIHSNRIYQYHLSKPFIYLVEHGFDGQTCKKREEYVRDDFDINEDNLNYNFATIKDFGLERTMREGAYNLQNERQISRYYKVKFKGPNDAAVTGFPFCAQYKREDMDAFVDEMGFQIAPPSAIVDVFNSDDDFMKNFSELALLMKEIENDPEKNRPIILSFGDGGNK